MNISLRYGNILLYFYWQTLKKNISLPTLKTCRKNDKNRIKFVQKVFINVFFYTNACFFVHVLQRVRDQLG